jgi:hypothetical protein
MDDLREGGCEGILERIVIEGPRWKMRRIGNTGTDEMVEAGLEAFLKEHLEVYRLFQLFLRVYKVGIYE